MIKGLNKIRGRIGFINRISYKKFILKYPKSEITYEKYVNILKESNKTIRDHILVNELGFKLPLNLGYIAITKFKQRDNYKVTDWKNTKLLQKIIPIMNFHSFGYMFKIKLYKNNRIKPFEIYQMQAHRIIKRMLAQRIKSGKQNYLELDNSYFNKRFSIERITGTSLN